MTRNDIRLALPSKGILQDGSIEYLEACGLKIFRSNPRQYAATIPSLPGVVVMFQRPGDIVTSVRAGSIDFGITGYDVLAEKEAQRGGEVRPSEPGDSGQLRRGRKRSGRGIS